MHGMAERIAEAFSVLGQFEAAALAGLRTGPVHDSVSGWDICVYAEDGLMADLERAMSRLYDIAPQGDDSALG